MCTSQAICQYQSCVGISPSSALSWPSSDTVKRPGESGRNQFFVRTHTRAMPSSGAAKRQIASRTGTPGVWQASRYGEPHRCVNCVSSFHWPAS